MSRLKRILESDYELQETLNYLIEEEYVLAEGSIPSEWEPFIDEFYGRDGRLYYTPTKRVYELAAFDPKIEKLHNKRKEDHEQSKSHFERLKAHTDNMKNIFKRDVDPDTAAELDRAKKDHEVKSKKYDSFLKTSQERLDKHSKGLIQKPKKNNTTNIHSSTKPTEKKSFFDRFKK